jgi:hypothetical protein
MFLERRKSNSVKSHQLTAIIIRGKTVGCSSHVFHSSFVKNEQRAYLFFISNCRLVASLLSSSVFPNNSANIQPTPFHPLQTFPENSADEINFYVTAFSEHFPFHSSPFAAHPWSIDYSYWIKRGSIMSSMSNRRNNRKSLFTIQFLGI